MATLDVGQAAMTIGRPPETIERWIRDGRVDAERVGPGWVVDMRSLLNAATAEDAARSGNGAAADHTGPLPAPPTDDPAARTAPPTDDPGARTAPPADGPDAPTAPPGATAAAGAAAEPVAPASPSAGERADPGTTPAPAPNGAALGPPPGVDSRLATLAANEHRPDRPSEPTVEIASAAISALSGRLEQAMSEIDRLHDERLKLALQLGYAQAQLKAAGEQLRALTAPPEPDPFTRLLRWLLRRDRPDAGRA